MIVAATVVVLFDLPIVELAAWLWLSHLIMKMHVVPWIVIVVVILLMPMMFFVMPKVQ